MTSPSDLLAPPSTQLSKPTPVIIEFPQQILRGGRGLGNPFQGRSPRNFAIVNKTGPDELLDKHGAPLGLIKFLEVQMHWSQSGAPEQSPESGKLIRLLQSMKHTTHPTTHLPNRCTRK